MKTKEVAIEVSARHVHLCKEDVEKLFGEGYELTKHHDISGAFVANERVSLVGPKRTMERVAILGPTRPETQVEISLTDARMLGVEAKIRLSGDLAGTEGIKLVAENGTEVDIDHGVIAAKRHLHCSDADAAELGIKTGDNVKLSAKNEMGRALVFDDVEVRVGGFANSVVHIDTDEGNAAGIGKADTVTMIVED